MDSSIPAGEFKARCLKLLDDVAATREPLTITKRGRAVARLVPVPEKRAHLFGCLAGSVLRADDLVTPITADWDAEQ